jgi:DNA-binding CsgD family transcriptional regulator
VREGGLLAAWSSNVRLPSPALSAGWWGVDPLGVLERHWIGRLAPKGVVVDIDHAEAEAVLGIAGPEAELARLLTDAARAGAGARIVALHAQLVAQHGFVTYFTRLPSRLRGAVRGWLVAAARAGGAQVIAIVGGEDEMPEDWAGGEERALEPLPQPIIGVGDLLSLAPRELLDGVPILAAAAFVSSCGGRLDVAALALDAWSTWEDARVALVKGTAGQRSVGSPLDLAMARLFDSLSPGERDLAADLARAVGAHAVAGAQVDAMVKLAGRGLAQPLGGRGRPRVRAASELMRTSIEAHLLEPAEVEAARPPSASVWQEQLQRLNHANEAMDAVAGRAPAGHLEQTRSAWGSSASADLVVAQIMEHHFLRAGASECLRQGRALSLPGPLSRAMLVRASLESGEIYRSVAELCRQELGRTPAHRDDDLVLDLAPPGDLRELMRAGLRAGERADLRKQAVALGRLVRLAQRPPQTEGQDAWEVMRAAFERRLFRVVAGQGMLIALGLGGYLPMLERVTDSLVRDVRPWHGALAGVHELALAVDEAGRGWHRDLDDRFQRTINHATAWHHGTVARAARVVATSTWAGDGRLGEDTDGALFRGARGFLSTWVRGLRGDFGAIQELAATPAPGADARTRSGVLWARAALQLVDPVEAAGQLADAREDLLVSWLANVALILDPTRQDPTTAKLLTQAGRGRAGAARNLDALRGLAEPSRLTPRELDVERARLAGEDIAATASKLGISERTVETHRSAVKAKAEVLVKAGWQPADARRWTMELQDLLNPNAVLNHDS